MVTAHPTNIYYGRNLMQLANTKEELFDLTKDKYQDSEFHHLPLMFANLYEKDRESLVIAKGTTRDVVMQQMAELRKYLPAHLASKVWFEPRYKFLTNTDHKSYIKFDSTGFKGGYRKICTMKKLKDILLYGFVPGKPEWELIYQAAHKRTLASGGRLLIHYA